MIKWSECHEGDVLYEVFLPEHEKEPCQWLVRASSRGHILAERRQSLTWPPRFGPDMGDVAVLEAAIEVLVNELATSVVPDGEGNYAPARLDIPPADPFVHAVQYTLIEEYAEAEASIGLTEEQSAAFLNLPVSAGAAGLYTLAVTPERDHRMRRVIALDRLMKSRPAIHALKDDLLGAVLADDSPRLRSLLEDAGILGDAGESGSPKGDSGRESG